MEYKTILYEPKNRIGWITLNRPQAMNALSTETIRELDHAIASISKAFGASWRFLQYKTSAYSGVRLAVPACPSVSISG